MVMCYGIFATSVVGHVTKIQTGFSKWQDILEWVMQECRVGGSLFEWTYRL